MQSVGCFCCLNMGMQKFFNCQDEQGTRQKTTQKKFKKNFSAEADQQRYIMSLVYKVYYDSLPQIRNEARLRGIKKGMVNVDNYADGVASIYLTAIVEKH